MAFADMKNSVLQNRNMFAYEIYYACWNKCATSMLELGTGEKAVKLYIELPQDLSK